jgi:pimeloyl-ACP methyl ester carboxylesterase
VSADVELGYAATPSGLIHFASAGAGPPLLLLHQTPRSWDEYAELIPLLAPQVRVIAMDTLGFGASAKPAGAGSIEAYATAALELLDALALSRVSVLGHHTGGVIAIEVAARAPERVDNLILSSTPLVDEAARQRRATRPAIDEVEVQPDGAHLTELWQRRQGFYPPDRPDILTRFVTDALRAGPNIEEGHRAVSRYRMEDALPKVKARTLLIGASADPYAFPELQPMAERLHPESTVVIDGGMVPLMEQKPAEVAEAVLAFLRSG